MFYSDRPINSGNEDKLNRKGFARLLARTLVNLDSKDTFTVGLFGKWGCGKTSLVNMTLEEIENIQAEDELKKEIIIVHFEPWNFTDTNQLLTQFFIRLANEFQKKGDKSLTKIGKALENYSDAFGLFELLPGVGAPIAAVGKWGFSRLGQKIQKGLDERDVLKQKNQVIQLLSAQSNRVLVVLDDIDRLNNEQIRYIFQLITSVARFPNMTYLLVFDKEKSNSLFDFPEWRMVYHLLNSFDPEYTKHYLESSLTQDTNILRFLRLFVTIWTGSGTEYEIQNGYDEYFSTERALSAIETCKKNRTILELPEELQHICAAFFLANSGNPECGNHIYQHATEKLISSWRM